MWDSVRVVRTGLILLGLAGSTFAPAAPKKGPAPQVNWWITQFTYVKRVGKEPSAPANDQPVDIAPEMVGRDLEAIRLNEEDSLFTKDEVRELVMPICEAFAQARPGEDLILLSTRARGGGILAPRTGITARLFIKEGRLNLILHDARLAFMDRYLGTHVLPDFKYGSRTEPSTAEMFCLGAEKVRNDWLTFPVILAAPVATAKALAPAQAMAPAPAPAAAPAPVVVPAPAPLPAAEPESKIPDGGLYDEQQQRLRGLKRLLDEKLITEEEYQQKRKEILQTL